MAIPAVVLPKQSTQENGQKLTSPRVAEITGRGLCWLRGHSPFQGCSREAASTAAHSIRNGLNAISTADPYKADDTVSSASPTQPTIPMTQQQIRTAISGISKLLGGNPELLAQQLTGLKALLPGLDENAITSIVEKTKAKGFNPHDLDQEIETVVSAVKAEGKK